VRYPWIPTTAQILFLIHLSIDLLIDLLTHLLFDLLIDHLIDLSIDPLIHLSFEISAPLCLHSEMSKNGERIQNIVSPHTITSSPNTIGVLFDANNSGQYVLSSLDDKTSLGPLLHYEIL